MTILFALLAAFSNALNVTTQHKASIDNPRGTRGWRLIPYLFTSPLWLFGWVALAGAFVFQALALHRGQMSVVQPLLVTELVFALVLRRIWVHQDIRPVTWWSAALTCLSLAIFLAMSEPQGGNAVPSSKAWVSASATLIGITVVLTVLGMWGPPKRRAALLASATAVLWALVATFLKTTTDTLSQFGLSGTFVHWPVYALAIAGIAAEVLNQVTLHVGPLSVSQPFLVIVDPIMSILLSVWIFEEYFTPDALRVTMAVLAFAGMCVAVTVLTKTAPETMDPTQPQAR
jgi:hypothetical protein